MRRGPGYESPGTRTIDRDDDRHENTPGRRWTRTGTEARARAERRVPRHAIGLTGSAFLDAIGEPLAPERDEILDGPSSRRMPYAFASYQELYDDRTTPISLRIDVFECIAREMRRAVDARLLHADDAARTLGHVARGADLDLDAAVAAAVVAFCDGRPDRGPGTTAMRATQTELVAGWVRQGWGEAC